MPWIAPTCSITVSDFANLPLLVLVSTVLSFLLLPALNAYSRYNERQADRYAFQSIASVGAIHFVDEQAWRTRTWPSDLLRDGWSGFSNRIPRFPGGWPLPKHGRSCRRSRKIEHFCRDVALLRLRVRLENLLHSAQIFLGIDSNRVVGRFRNVDRNSIFRENVTARAVRCVPMTTQATRRNDRALPCDKRRSRGA